MTYCSFPMAKKMHLVSEIRFLYLTHLGTSFISIPEFVYADLHEAFYEVQFLFHTISGDKWLH